MATSYNWIIEQMWVKPQEDGHTDVVVTAAWRCNAADAGFTATAYGTASFVYQGESFTPYDQLTQEQVLGWCWTNGVDKDVTEENLNIEIQSHINPVIIPLPLPWN